MNYLNLDIKNIKMFYRVTEIEVINIITDTSIVKNIKFSFMLITALKYW